MNSLYEIMDMLNSNHDTPTQERGIRLANRIKDLRVFLQPADFGNKAVWENSAKVLAQKTDDELEPYLVHLLEWLQDINWPGAFVILNRLKTFSGEKLKSSYLKCVDHAIRSNNEEGLTWLDYLSQLLDNEELKAVPKKTLQVLAKHYQNWTWWYKE